MFKYRLYLEMLIIHFEDFPKNIINNFTGCKCKVHELSLHFNYAIQMNIPLKIIMMIAKITI